MTLNGIARFYAPYASPRMDRKFQLMEIWTPLVFQFLMGAVTAGPLWYIHQWTWAALVTIGMCVVYRTISSGMNYLSADPAGYISPSVGTAADMVKGVLFAGVFGITFFVLCGIAGLLS